MKCIFLVWFWHKFFGLFFGLFWLSLWNVCWEPAKLCRTTHLVKNSPFWCINCWKLNSKFEYWGTKQEFLGHTSYGWRTDSVAVSDSGRLPVWAMQAKPALLSAQQLSGSCATTSSQLSPKHRGLELSKGCRQVPTIRCVSMSHLFYNNIFRVPLRPVHWEIRPVPRHR